MVSFVAPPSVLPDISPTSGEIGWALPLDSASAVLRESIHLQISPLVGEMSGRTQGVSPATNGASSQ
jgi:cobaltochelatase CobN